MSSSVSTRFATLPFELVDKILWHAAQAAAHVEPSALVRLALVSKATNALATPLLYSTVILGTHNQVEKFLALFLAKRTTFFIQYVHTLSVVCPPCMDELALDCMTPFIDLAAGLSFFQAPIDIVVALFVQHPDERLPFNISFLLASRPPLRDDDDWQQNLRRVTATHLHMSADVRNRTLEAISDPLHDAMRSITHLSIDASVETDQGCFQQEKHAARWSNILSDILRSDTLQQVVIRLPGDDGLAAENSHPALVQVLTCLEDPRVTLLLERGKYSDLDPTTFAVDGFKRHVAGIQDLWSGSLFPQEVKSHIVQP